MKPRRIRKPHVNHERWLVSYADFVTLLFAFFVVLYSVAQVDKRKVVELAQAIQYAFNNGDASAINQSGQTLQIPPALLKPETTAAVPRPAPREDTREMNDLRQELEGALKKEIAQGEVSIRKSSEGLVISLQEAGFFESGSTEIQTNSQAVFGRLANMLAARGYRVRIEGHTDNRPIHNSQYNSNWELSTARASEVVRRLIMQYQFPPELLSAAGYAEFHPVASNDTEAGRAANRRVDVVVLGKPTIIH
ncbi:MAG TPA: flagellar motor protein MotB [Terriglobales bacterium]